MIVEPDCAKRCIRTVYPEPKTPVEVFFKAEFDASAWELEVLVGDHDFEHLPDHWTYADILHALGEFASAEDARAQGWHTPIPGGLIQFRFGDTIITTLKPWWQI